MLFTSVKLIALTFIYFILESKCEKFLLASLSQGVLQGVSKVSSEGKQFTAFLGIPYAKPPIGELRFEPPESRNPWDGIFNATKPGSDCLQYDIFKKKTMIGSEDCLFLNVYTSNLPTFDNNKKLPVIVFIHGGGFMAGSGSPDQIYGPEFIMNRDVVFVTINYRVGVLGFLSLSNLLISGNMGLKDQALALKWVKENIESFGGDSNKIIIYGESAGGASVHYQMLSPLTKGLFNGVIAMSGTSLAKWAFMDEELSKKRAKCIANFVHCPNDLNKETAKCLKQVNGHDLVEAVTRIKEDNGLSVIVLFSPTVEPEGSKNIFISERPEEIIKKGNINDVPLIMGYTSNEGLPFALTALNNTSMLSVMRSNYKSWLSVVTELKDRVNDDLTIAEEAKYHYYGEKRISENSVKELSQLLSDCMFLYSIYKAGQLYLTRSTYRSPMYLFRLSAHPEHKRTTIVRKEMHGQNISGLGVGHAEDLNFVFHTNNMTPISSEKDMLISNHLIDILVNFAATGQPQDGNNISIWKPLRPDFHYTDINYELKENHDFPVRNIMFWERLFVMGKF